MASNLNPVQTAANPSDPANPGLNPDLAGYPSAEALAHAYRASGQEAQRLRAENEALRQQFTLAANQSREVPQRNPDPYQELRDSAIPVDSLREVLRRELQQELRPLLGAVQARTELLGRYPEYGQFESDVAAFIAADPQLSERLSRMAQADPAGASEYAFLRFGESRRRSHPAAENQEQTRQAMSDARIPTSRAGETRAVPAESDQNVAAAYDYFQKSGDPTALVLARIRQSHSEDFLRKLQSQT